MHDPRAAQSPRSQEYPDQRRARRFQRDRGRSHRRVPLGRAPIGGSPGLPGATVEAGRNATRSWTRRLPPGRDRGGRQHRGERFYVRLSPDRASGKRRQRREPARYGDAGHEAHLRARGRRSRVLAAHSRRARPSFPAGRERELPRHGARPEKRARLALGGRGRRRPAQSPGRGHGGRRDPGQYARGPHRVEQPRRRLGRVPLGRRRPLVRAGPHGSHAPAGDLQPRTPARRRGGYERSDRVGRQRRGLGVPISRAGSRANKRVAPGRRARPRHRSR